MKCRGSGQECYYRESYADKILDLRVTVGVLSIWDSLFPRIRSISTFQHQGRRRIACRAVVGNRERENN